FGRWGDGNSAQELARALEDESPEIRIATMRSLIKLGVDKSYGTLAKIAQNPEAGSGERAWAARALGRTTNRNGGVDQLMALLRSAKEPGVRAASMDGLRRLS